MEGLMDSGHMKVKNKKIKKKVGQRMEHIILTLWSVCWIAGNQGLSNDYGSERLKYGGRKDHKRREFLELK